MQYLLKYLLIKIYILFITFIILLNYVLLFYMYYLLSTVTIDYENYNI